MAENDGNAKMQGINGLGQGYYGQQMAMPAQTYFQGELMAAPIPAVDMIALRRWAFETAMLAEPSMPLANIIDYATRIVAYVASGDAPEADA